MIRASAFAERVRLAVLAATLHGVNGAFSCCPGRARPRPTREQACVAARARLTVPAHTY